MLKKTCTFLLLICLVFNLFTGVQQTFAEENLPTVVITSPVYEPYAAAGYDSFYYNQDITATADIRDSQGNPVTENIRWYYKKIDNITNTLIELGTHGNSIAFNPATITNGLMLNSENVYCIYLNAEYTDPNTKLKATAPAQGSDIPGRKIIIAPFVNSNIDCTQSNEGESVQVTGQIQTNGLIQEGTQATIALYASDKTALRNADNSYIRSTGTISNGNVTVMLQIPTQYRIKKNGDDLQMTAGDYLIRLSIGDGIRFFPYKIIASKQNNQNQILLLDKTEANLGDTVTFSVYSKDASNVNKPYEIYFLDKDSNTFSSDKLWSPDLNDYYSDTVYAYGTLDGEGKGTAEFKLPTDINTGTYGFSAYFYGAGKSIATDLKLTVASPGTNKGVLQSAINSANSNKASAAVSLDGTDTETEHKWVTQEIMTAYETAIAAAQGIYDKANAVQAEVDQAVTSLDLAAGVFNSAKKDGTKQAAYAVTFSAGENGTLTAAVDEKAVNTGSIVVKGKDIIFTATPAENYRVKEWTIDGAVVSGNKNNVLTISSIQAPKTVTVAFEKLSANVTYPVARQTLIQALDKATDKLIEKFNDSSFNYQQHWMAIAISGFGKAVPGSYLNAVENGDMPAANSGQYGKYILGILAAGGDPTNINGRNLLAELCQLSDMKNVNAEGGIYTTPFGLLALDAVNCQIPADAGFTRDDIINKLISLADPKGGEDGVGFVLTALGKYYNEKPAVKAAVDKVVAAWAERQGEDGGFGAGAWSVENNVNTAAQVLMGLSFNGIDPQDKEFTKAKGNLISFILSFQNADGTFNWQKNEPGSISMATEQAVYALAQYLRQLDGKKSIYDFTGKEHESHTVKVLGIPAGDKPKVQIPSDNNDCKIPITAEDSDKEITINIPVDNAAKVFVGLPQNSSLPEIVAAKGNVTVLLPKGIQVTGGNASQIELITSKDTNDTAIKNKINDIIPDGKKLDSIVRAFSMGDGQTIEFNSFITLTFKGMQGKEAAYIQSGILHPIQKYSDDSAGLASGKNEYAYDSGNDLIVKTKHFTDFVAYNVSTIASPPAGGGVQPQPAKSKYAALSVDKLTISEGYVIQTVKVELQSGDTAWTLLKRELDKRGISCKYIWTEAYGSVYVQSIDGDGEFDHGSGSGWMYAVNGWYPNYGATKYILKDGDSLQWRYTTNLGADLGEDLSRWDNPKGEEDKTDPVGNTPPIDIPKDTEKDNTSNASKENADTDNNNTAVSTPESESGKKIESIDLKRVYTDTGSISSWAYKAVGDAAKKGFISGSAGKFRPKAPITRAEFIKIMVCALGLDTKAGNVIHFTDVNENSWFYPYVNAAYKAGIIKGNGNKFKPDEKITREQMAAILVRALGIKPLKPSESIKDIKEVSGCFKSDVETIYAIGLMTGDNSRFNPGDFATREMAAVVVMKAYACKNDEYAMTIDVKSYIAETAALMQKTVSNPVVASVGGEWTVLSLARSGTEVPESYYEKYYENVEKKLKETSGVLHKIKYTEYDRVILALSSLGKDVTNVEGYDLTRPLADFNTVIKQGLNGPVWALLALDSKGYQIPEDKEISVQTTRAMLENYILSKEIQGGGWSLTSEAPADTDITAMALQALSKYKDKEEVQAAIDRALSFLSSTQEADGSFKSSWGDGTSSESIAQVIVALTSLGIDPVTDKRFIKNGNNPISALLTFYVNGGGFKHTKDGELDAMAADQGMYALVAYDRFINGQKPLYDMTDVK